MRCYGFGSAGWVAWGLAGAPAALRAAVARARGGGEDKGRWFALPGRDQSSLRQAIGARGQHRREGHGVTDDSAFKKQVRARMAFPVKSAC
jgi:hypothetical protein